MGQNSRKDFRLDIREIMEMVREVFTDDFIAAMNRKFSGEAYAMSFS